MRPVQRTATSLRRPAPLPQQRSKQRAWFAAALTAVLMLVLYMGVHHGSATANALRSGLSGTCLDVQHSGTTDGTPLDAVRCNGTGAQNWVTTATTIRQAHTNACMTTGAGGAIVLSSCSATASQVWLRDGQGYLNPNSGQCLDASNVGMPLHLATCGSTSSAGETWSPGTAAQLTVCSGNERAMIACDAVKQWMAWQAAEVNHESLLTTYTDGTPSEEWCADFVSYVYKQAGYPFTGGSADGWDQNDANAIQYMGFTKHMAGSGYQPQPGDVAFFNYPGGHVEIVVSGGAKPTFVYGNSAEIDPTTGNGQMKANTITQDGSRGGLVYYLSPS